MNVRYGSGAPIAAGSNPPEIPIADVLSRAGHELVQLAWLLEHLQSHIGPLMQEAAARDANILRQVQSFDHIGQKATGLADFLAALAQAVPRRWLVDAGAAAQTVTLADLSSRLGFAGEEKDSCLTARGDCELF
ncbi:MAG TPA: hypothetical protein VMU78_08665 [Methylocella sp.]|nr:hypothetical protein [Methylocella sp.]